MKTLTIETPFNAPVYYEESVSSTMDVSRVLAERGEAHGTVILADFQTAGRGRNRRRWTGEKGQNLMFTILLRYGGFDSIPKALTLKAGLAISLAMEDAFPTLAGNAKIKWPNDIMLCTSQGYRKAVGILSETEGSLVFLGVGINLCQRSFPEEIKDKAVSIAMALNELSSGEKNSAAMQHDAQTLLLEKILFRLYDELENKSVENWKPRLEERLYKKGEQVTFIEGAADSGKLISGRLEGLGADGELLLVANGETAPRPFHTGELKVY